MIASPTPDARTRYRQTAVRVFAIQAGTRDNVSVLVVDVGERA